VVVETTEIQIGREQVKVNNTQLQLYCTPAQYTPVQKDPHFFVFALNYSKPNDMPNCLHHRRRFHIRLRFLQKLFASLSASVHAKSGAKAMDKVWFEKRHRCCTRPGGLASFRDHPDEFLRNTFLSVVFCEGVPLPLGWRFVTKLMLADLDSSVFGKTRPVRKISKSRTHCFKPDCLKRSNASCILPGSSLL
jgi:hypothetical protein